VNLDLDKYCHPYPIGPVTSHQDGFGTAAAVEGSGGQATAALSRAYGFHLIVDPYRSVHGCKVPWVPYPGAAEGALSSASSTMPSGSSVGDDVGIAPEKAISYAIIGAGG
jgi:hypothetical protein